MRPPDFSSLYLSRFLVRALTKWWMCRRGSVMVVAALSALPVMLGVAAAVDLGTVVNTRSKLQSLADAASLQAAKQANNSLASGSSTTTDAALAVARTTAQSMVTANAQISGLSSVPSVSVSYTPQTSYSGSVTVALSQTPKLFFSGLLPAGNKTVSVQSTATMAQGNSYIQVLFLVDISNSMGIGGTPSDIQQLENGPGQCAFACHDPHGYDAISNNCVLASAGQWQGSGWYSVWRPPCDMRTVAKASGISLKIDYVSQSLQAFVSQLVQYAQDDRNHITVGIDTFGTVFSRVVLPTTDLSQATSAAANVDIEDATPFANQYNNPNRSPSDWADYNGGYTKTQAALQQVATDLQNVGDGSSSSSMKTYIIFISDGAEELYSASGKWHTAVDVNYGAACTALKNKGVRLFSVLVPYYPIPGNTLYDALVAPFDGTGEGSMQYTMQTCASASTDFIQADDGPAIKQALSSVFDTIIADSALHLTH
ncbi:pilus assembly protein [Acetobacter estunensis]|uniref:pilus assembly protein n=1 Tax=Acetobacter estunensis TaxID=104097 RepID=UPI001C2D0BA5|nr:pilus assembly protein [Acetobacter estunensis]MBV1837974.1 pilus assembly protein [Acetobacter estunensis]